MPKEDNFSPYQGAAAAGAGSLMKKNDSRNSKRHLHKEESGAGQQKPNLLSNKNKEQQRSQESFEGRKEMRNLNEALNAAH